VGAVALAVAAVAVEDCGGNRRGWLVVVAAGGERWKWPKLATRPALLDKYGLA
jgi:hypothetical protein